MSEPETCATVHGAEQAATLAFLKTLIQRQIYIKHAPLHITHTFLLENVKYLVSTILYFTTSAAETLHLLHIIISSI